MTKDRHYNLFKSWIDTNKNDTLDLNVAYDFSENGEIGVSIYFKENDRIELSEMKEFLSRIKKRVLKKLNFKLNLVFMGRWELKMSRMDYSKSESLATLISQMEYDKNEALKYKKYDFKAHTLASDEEVKENLIKIGLNIWDDFNEDDKEKGTFAYFEVDDEILSPNNKRKYLEKIKDEMLEYNKELDLEVKLYRSVEHYPNIKEEDFHYQRWEIKIKNTTYNEIEDLTDYLDKKEIVFDNYLLEVYSES